jgi:hypothetical protein
MGDLGLAQFFILKGIVMSHFSRSFRRSFVVSLLALAGAMLPFACADETAPVAFDFSPASQLADLSPQGTTHYSVRTAPGVGSAPGVLQSDNSGAQDAALFYTKERFDLKRGGVSTAVFFKADGRNGRGVARIFLGAADKPTVNLASGTGKIGVRLFKADAPKTPATPWLFQFSNGWGTRDLGEPFALEDGHWYQIRLTLGTDATGKQIAFEAALQEFDADGKTPGTLKRERSGNSKALTTYDLGQMLIGLLGQNNNGGATAFDDWEIKPLVKVGPAPPPDLQPVTFLPRVLSEKDTAPPNTMFGVCSHFMHSPLFYPKGNFSPYWQLEYTMPLLVEAHLGWARETLYQPWFDDDKSATVQQNRKQVEEYLAQYQRAGVRVMLVPMLFSAKEKPDRVAFRDGYFQWIGSLCRRFPNVRVIEMHNEPNLKFFWKGTPEEYVEAYRKGAEIIRAQAPQIAIAIGSLSSLWWQPGIDWLQKVLDAGALQWADAVSVHPYNIAAAPESDPHFTGGDPNSGDHMEQAVAAFYDKIKKAAPAGKTIALYFTEFGYSSGQSGAALGDEQKQADYLSRLMLIHLASRLRGIPLEGVFWYDLKNDGINDHAESNYGLVSYETGRLKPAYDCYRRIAEAFSDPSQLKPLDLKASFSNWPDAIKYYTWRRSDGALIVPVWRLDQRASQDRDFSTQLSLTLPPNFRAGRVLWHSLQEDLPREIGYSTAGGGLNMPLVLTPRAAWLEIRPAP